MRKVNWTKLKQMDESEIKEEWKGLIENIEKLSDYEGQIKNDEDHEKFLDDFSYCLDMLHGLRSRIENKYFYSS